DAPAARRVPAPQALVELRKSSDPGAAFGARLRLAKPRRGERRVARSTMQVHSHLGMFANEPGADCRRGRGPATRRAALRSRPRSILTADRAGLYWEEHGTCRRLTTPGASGVRRAARVRRWARLGR